ncbi:hypothetical protein ACHAXR_000480 [Thalassiosira sp. AJA248-18]
MSCVPRRRRRSHFYIDPDPKHFGIILSYLRNKADGVYRHPSVGVVARRQLVNFGSGGSGSNSGNNNCQAAATQIITKTMPYPPHPRFNFQKIPTHYLKMYFESIHYNIPELSDRICSHSRYQIYGHGYLICLDRPILSIWQCLLW